MIFLVLNVFSAFVVRASCPETSGRTLEEFDLLYSRDSNRLFVVDNRGRFLPSFRSRMNGQNDLENSVDDRSSDASGSDAVGAEKGFTEQRALIS